MKDADLSHRIAYQCVRPEHQESSATDRVFVHAEGWAYCPSGRLASEHRFIATGGLERRRIEGGMTFRGPGDRR